MKLLGLALLIGSVAAAEGRFKIAGGEKGQRVSWQVVGIRQDAWVKAQPTSGGRRKSEEGLYSHPEAFSLPKEKSLSTLFIK